MDTGGPQTNPGTDPRLTGRPSGGPQVPPISTSSAGNEGAGRPPSRHNPTWARSNGAGSQSRSGTSEGSDQPSPTTKDPTSDLISVLDRFTTHVVAVASLTMQRDIAEKQRTAGGQEQPESNLAFQDFPALAKHQEHRNAHTSREFKRLDEGLDEALRQHIAEREKLSYSMAAIIKSGGSNTDSEKIHRLESQLNNIRADLREQTQVFGQYRRLMSDTMVMRTDLNKLTEDHSSTAKHGRRDAMRLDKIENRVNDFPNLRLEISKIREELKAANMDLNTRFGHPQGSTQSDSSLKKDLDLAKEDIKGLIKTTQVLEPRIEKLEVDVKDAPNWPAEFSKMVEENRASASNFLHNMAELQASVKSADKILSNIQASNKTLDEKLEDVHTLKELIEGDDGLVHSVAQLEETNEKFRIAFRKTDEELEQYDLELGKFGDRVTNIEGGKAMTDKTGNSSNSENLEGSVADKIARIEENLESFRAEQQVRDDFVTDEIEKMSKATEDGLTQVRERLQQEISRIDGALSRAQQPAAHAALTQDLENSVVPLQQNASGSNDRNSFPPSKSPALGDRVWSPDVGSKLDPTLSQPDANSLPQLVRHHRLAIEKHHRALEACSQRIKALEMTSQHLDTRFNNLTTDEVTKHMVSQMREMYPHASNTQLGFETVKTQQDDLGRKIQELSEKVREDAEARQSHVTGELPNEETISQRLEGLENKVESLKGPAADGESTPGKPQNEEIAGRLQSEIGSIRELLDRTQHQNANAMEKINELNSKVDSIWDHSANEFATLSSSIENMIELNDLIAPPSPPPAEPTTEQTNTDGGTAGQNQTNTDDGTAGQTQKRKDRDSSEDSEARKRQRVTEGSGPQS
ncbi:MAG: hypothetical protein M1837_003150 [Sclerophora amabilis]|nr:MAG: hypothetical protein M1837_003150 [Sclerophora amabilis]